MNKIIFAFGILISTNIFAATGSGHAQTELATPLSISFPSSINFGSIAIDPGVGAQTVTLSASANEITCPTSYVCTGSLSRGIVRIEGMGSTMIYVDMSGSTATLSDGSGNNLVFDPIFSNATDSWTTLATNPDGSQQFAIGGTIDFTGNEVSGTYSSQNAGGTGYTVTVNY